MFTKPTSFFLLFFVLSSCTKHYEIKTSTLTGIFNKQGELCRIISTNRNITRDIKAFSELGNCTLVSISQTEDPGKSIRFTKNLKDTLNNQAFTLIETFSEGTKSIHWEIELIGKGMDCSLPIITYLQYPVTNDVKFWAPWADPRGKEIEARPDNALIANAIVPNENIGGNWADPLVAMPPANALWFYGAPNYQYSQPGLVYCPFQGDVICIPMATFLENGKDFGLSLVLSHEDLMLDMHINTTADGKLIFSRLNHRLGSGKTIKFSMDIILHQADWRSSMAWAVNRYPKYYEPVIAAADTVVGTAAYSNKYVDFDAEKLKKMAFKVNWRASFDFPYMGQFIPPVKTGVEWNSFLRARHVGVLKPWKVSIPAMEEYCQKMNAHGFNVLSYFNVTEFGTQIQFPAPSLKTKNNKDLWKDPNDFLYSKLSDAILFVPDSQIAVLDIGQYSVKPGEPFRTWEGAVAMDPAEPTYQNFLVQQAQRHVDEIPGSSGICIDRMDWLRFYNHKRNDGVSWFGNQPVGSLNVSWHNLMGRLDTVFHKNNKLIYVNNHTKRIDHLRYIDGILDEFTYAGAPLNTIALMCVNKPAMGWMSNEKQLRPDPDAVMQKYLYLGVFPMAPYPGNDHSLQPSAFADSVYLDYGPLLKRMTGKKWILEPHVIEVANQLAKANIFKTFYGYTIPVVYGGNNKMARVAIRKKELVSAMPSIVVMHPGNETPIKLEGEIINGQLIINTPLIKGCAVLLINIGT